LRRRFAASNPPSEPPITRARRVAMRSIHLRRAYAMAQDMLS
jgi:hypothetical protein